MFHPVNLPVQGRENRQPGRDSQDQHNTARILCLRLGASLISLGRLNPLHRSCEAPSNFCFTFWANDLTPLSIRSRTVCLVFITGCCDSELDSEVSRPGSMSCIMRGNIKAKGRVWVRVGTPCCSTGGEKASIVSIDHPGVHVLTWSQKDKVIKKKEDDSSRGGKAAKVMTRTSTKTFIPKVLAVQREVTTCTL